MACRYQYAGQAEAILSQKLSETTRLLCEVWGALQQRTRRALLAEIEGLREWLDAHEEADRQREAADREQRERQEAHKARQMTALAKLTPEERQALGVD